MIYGSPLTQQCWFLIRFSTWRTPVHFRGVGLKACFGPTFGITTCARQRHGFGVVLICQHKPTSNDQVMIPNPNHRPFYCVSFLNHIVSSRPQCVETGVLSWKECDELRLALHSREDLVGRETEQVISCRQVGSQAIPKLSFCRIPRMYNFWSPGVTLPQL